MEYIDRLKRSLDLTFEEARTVFAVMLDGDMEQEDIVEILVLLANKGETAGEIAGAAQSLRERAIPLPHTFDRLLDTCGTGGDNSGSFNISTTSAIVCSLFVPVAKHGNRAVSSLSGSADVLEALRVPIDLDAEGAARFLKEKNFVFLFAQKFFPAMKYVTAARKRIGKRTIFNLLGPLCNPSARDLRACDRDAHRPAGGHLWDSAPAPHHRGSGHSALDPFRHSAAPPRRGRGGAHLRRPTRSSASRWRPTTRR